MIPQNLLGAALSIIGKQSFQYVRNTNRNPNSIGFDVPVYAPPIAILGSVQAVPRDLLEKYGLDLQAGYKMFYVSQYINDVHRVSSGDQFFFSREKYQALSDNDWFPINGWVSVLCVHVPGGCAIC